MFTGLIADRGQVAAVNRTSDGVHLEIATRLAAQLHAGDSVAVSGVCLTATAVHPTTGTVAAATAPPTTGTVAAAGSFSTDVMNETLRRSALAEIRPGVAVNLELALRADGRFGGHIVQGHVDSVGRVASVSRDGFSARVEIAAPAPTLRYVVEKGSIAVDGVSLTVAALHADSFTVALIPETLERTTLGQAAPGTVVNLEVDVLAKYVERLIQR